MLQSCGTGVAGDIAVVGPGLVSIQIAPDSARVDVGATLQLTAFGITAAGTSESVSPSWRTSNPDVATVSGTGIVTARATGIALIEAISGALADSVRLSVVPGIGAISVDSVRVTPANASVAQTATVQLTAQVFGGGSILAGRPVTWTSSAPGVATVSGTGLVTAVGCCSATITASSGGRSGTSTVTITAPPVASAAYASPSATFVMFETPTAIPVLRDRTGNVLSPLGRNISYASSDSGVVMVRPDGSLVTMGLGTASITASVEGKTATMSFTITAPPAETTPAGFTQLVDRPFNTLAQSATDIAGAEGFLANGEIQSIFNRSGSIVADPYAVRSGPSIFNVVWPVGTVGGGTQGQIERNLPGTSPQVHVTLWIKYSLNYQGHLTGTSPKVIIPFSQNQPRIVVRGRGAGASRLNLSVALQGVPDARSSLEPNQNVAAAEIVRGQWQRWDMRFKANTPGVANGEVHAWVNGVKVIEYTDVMVARVGELPNFQVVKYNAIWGGLGDAVLREMSLKVDHLSIYTAP